MLGNSRFFSNNFQFIIRESSCLYRPYVVWDQKTLYNGTYTYALYFVSVMGHN
jgi:hypothetical protein